MSEEPFKDFIRAAIERHDARFDAMRQRISDVNDAALYDRLQLEERIDALEERVNWIEKKLNHKGGTE